jgi:hypothetical protein
VRWRNSPSSRAFSREHPLGSFDDALPGGKFLLVSPPPHPFRFGRRIGPCAQAFAAELTVQRRRPALKTTETVLALAAVSKAVSLPAPKCDPPFGRKSFVVRRALLGHKNHHRCPPKVGSVDVNRTRSVMMGTRCCSSRVGGRHARGQHQRDADAVRREAAAQAADDLVLWQPGRLGDLGDGVLTRQRGGADAGQGSPGL